MKNTPMWERRRQLFGEQIITATPDINLVGFKTEKFRDVYSLLTDAEISDSEAIEFIARKEGKPEQKFMMGTRTNTDRLSYIEVVRLHER